MHFISKDQHTAKVSVQYTVNLFMDIYVNGMVGTGLALQEQSTKKFIDDLTRIKTKLHTAYWKIMYFFTFGTIYFPQPTLP